MFANVVTRDRTLCSSTKPLYSSVFFFSLCKARQIRFVIRPKSFEQRTSSLRPTIHQRRVEQYLTQLGRNGYRIWTVAQIIVCRAAKLPIRCDTFGGRINCVEPSLKLSGLQVQRFVGPKRLCKLCRVVAMFRFGHVYFVRVTTPQ